MSEGTRRVDPTRKLHESPDMEAMTARRDRGGQRAWQPESQVAPGSRPAPGKVTRTSKRSPERAPAVQRRAAPAGNEATPPRRSLRDFTEDPAMDAVHRGLTAVAQSGQAVVQMSPASLQPAAPAALSAASAASSATRPRPSLRGVT